MTTHHFQPTHYHTTIGPHEPVLRIAPGDTVVTTTVDARGQDSSGEQITTPGNPMTGPFYIEGAEPGDTLVVHLDKLTPNRPFGWTRRMVAANVVDPNYIPYLPWPADEAQSLASWQVDLDAETVTLVEPETALGQIALPLNPMVGCFGVAPARGEAISTATSSHHGGNMDYNGFVAGTTVYFPVLTAGALFHIGDGHAVQGDGEIVGTGVEISFDVEFTVELRKGWQTYWPRGENNEFIFTVGNARPLDQCVQHATTEMLRWLQADYGLTGEAAHLLLGQAVQYDLGNIFDPAYTMVCKVAKRWLPTT
ncbi:MAG: acetamidase/formamidase family protein [Caldilineaceae bacterium]|nr:acetamidase/formamidase family protein [Caldilineaceae bacterium]